MVKYMFKSLILSLSILVSAPAFSGDSDGDVDVNELIMHHVQDAHEWHVMGSEHGDDAVSIPLPIILIDNGLHVFSSSRLYHDGEIVHFTNEDEEKDYYLANKELGYGMHHEKIYKLDENGELSFHDGHAINDKPLDFSITKNVFSLFFSALLLFLILKASVKSYKNSGGLPSGIGRFVEPLVIFVRDDIAKVNIGEKKYERFMPYLLTAFFFIWINNLLGLIPIFPGGANLSGSISFTLTLAVFTLLFTVFSGNKHYWQHIFATPGVPKALLPIMVPIEIIGIFTKPFALMIRLFANITAGHIIILSLVGIIFTFQNAAWGALSVPMALFISVLELLVAFLQAFIFTMLSALFIGTAVAEHH